MYIELPCFTKELKDLKTFFEQWIFIIKHLHELNDLPEKFRENEVFEIIFEIAKIARMSKYEVKNYLKDLNNMNIVRNEIRTRDNIIAQRDSIIAQRDNIIAQKDNTIAQKNNTIAEQSSIIAEYERKYGVLKW